MNKTHWNTITIGGDVPVDELKSMVGYSYDLIKSKVRERKYGNTFILLEYAGLIAIFKLGKLSY